jgi:serine protease
VVVAVVDTGITPSYDIVGPNGLVQAGMGSNLISVGYDFISDCRVRGSCAATILSANAIVAPSPNATDLGNFVSAQDIIDNPTLFPGPNPSNSTWHGTHVAGTIAAIANNNRGVVGGAYGAKILPVRVLGKGGGFTSNICDGILWAAGVHPTIPNPNPAKVINMSMGGTGSCSVTEQSAINAAVAAGAVIVVAAGNANVDVANHSPANCQNVISVAAIGRDGSRASYSNFSSPASNVTNPSTITLAAPGGDISRYDYNAAFDFGIISAVNAGTTTMKPSASGGSVYNFKQGTSMATPLVSAAVALMLSKDPTLTPAQVKSILSAPSSLTAFPSFGASSYPAQNNMDCTVGNNCGTGILNAKLALQNTPSNASGGGGSTTPTTTTTANRPTAKAPSSGGGGCAIMPAGATPDISLLLAMIAIAAYWLRRRVVREQSAD